MQDKNAKNAKLQALASQEDKAVSKANEASTESSRRDCLKTSAQVGSLGLAAKLAGLSLFGTTLANAQSPKANTIAQTTNLSPSDIDSINAALAKGAPIPARGYAATSKE